MRLHISWFVGLDKSFSGYVLCGLLAMALSGCTLSSPSHRDPVSVAEMPIMEKIYADDGEGLTVGVANISTLVSVDKADSIERNKERILRAIDVFKRHGCNIVVFPECCVTGYFWHDPPACWKYMRRGVINKHKKWLGAVKGKLDDGLQYVILNGIRLNPENPEGPFLNSTYVINQKFDCSRIDSPVNEKSWIYDKTLLPGIENTFCTTDGQDRLTFDTEWGRFGVATCYELCFTQPVQRYSMRDEIDVLLVLASWRGGGTRKYPGLGVERDNYYGYMWNVMAGSQAAFNQIWVMASNTVGYQDRGDYEFWGGAGIWAPSGVKLAECSHGGEELMILRNVDIEREIQREKDDLDYSRDFFEIYDFVDELGTYTRFREERN